MTCDQIAAMVRKEKIKVAVALSKRERDFEVFRKEVFSSERLAERVDLVPSHDKENLKKIISDAEILVCFSVERKTFLAARKLKWIHCGSAGVDQLLFPEMLASKVLLTTSKGIHREAVSDHVMAMILAFSRGLVAGWNGKQKREWRPIDVMRQRFELEGRYLAIVGFGTIGESLARKAKAFGMKVMATKNRLKKGERAKCVDELLPKHKLNHLLCTADVVVLTVPHTKETHHLVGKRELACMKESAILINVARGDVVDERALVDTLSKKKIAGAGLDVFEEEPLDPKSKLWDLDNVTLTPHIAGARRDYYARVAEIFRINLNRHLNKRPLRNLFDKKLGY